ncbi:MAG: hypothetical protein QOG86_534 [Thermoleophilaceae bacterium]|jgi:hypothetical protein|nr:hypothetical protein [Thermoleophilaceae bacterium]
MRHKLRPRITYANVMATIAVVVALGGGAYAVAGFAGSDGRIHGCVDSKGGLTILRPPATKCGAGRTKIAWNQRGARAPGAKQFERGVPSGKVATVATADGVKVIGNCEDLHPDAVAAEVRATDYSGFSWSPGDPFQDYSELQYASDQVAVHIDVLARAYPATRWTHFRIVGYRRSGYCLFSGTITPRSD